MADEELIVEQKEIDEHKDVLKHVDEHEHTSVLDREKVERLEDLGEVEEDTIHEIKERIAHPLSFRHRDLMHLLAHISKEVREQEKIIKKIEEDGQTPEDLEELKKLMGELDAEFGSMMGSFVFIFRALNTYYQNKSKMSELLFPKEHKEKYEKLITRFLYYMPTLVKYNISVSAERGKGVLVLMTDLLRKLCKAEGVDDTRLGSRRQMRKLVGTKIFKKKQKSI